MKEIFLALRTLLKNANSKRWIDLEKGQMNTTRPSISFPAALLTITVPRIETITTHLQDCNVAITVRLCYDFTGKTNSAMEEEQVKKSLAYLDDVDAVHKLLQGYESDFFNKLNRINVLEEQRPDGYKVVQLNYSTTFREDTSS
jgi:hypothetical protein